MASQAYNQPVGTEPKDRRVQTPSTGGLNKGADGKAEPSRWFSKNASRVSIVCNGVARMLKPKGRRRWLYGTVGIVIVVLWVGLILAFAREQQKSEEFNEEGDSRQFTHAYAPGTTPEFWFFKGELRRLDTDGQTLAVQWSASQYNPGNDTYTPLLASSEDIPMGLNVYRDIYAVFDSNVTDAIDDGFERFMLDNATAFPVGNVGVRECDAFDTDIDLTEATGSVWSEPSRGYPFDKWAGSIVLVVNNIGASLQYYNRTNALAGSFDGIYLGGSLLNWKVTANSSSTCYNPPSSTNCELHVDFDIRRSGLVKFTVIAVVIVNWLSTIVIFLLTAETLYLGRSKIIDGTDMLSVLFAALFALPGVRSLLPGAPSFGSTIDLVGVLPNVIIISLCTSCWAIAKLCGRGQEQREGSKSLAGDA
ncbi:hypothetical protein BD626DRAFT_504870 [Schizophyllum amplum]|uniref:Uncharacterized protein n=1 Tax=Schizophyllum amplum TaxID=97359 RepID=A0A550C683_9AGAR|nr:hypothetical protein BD626DRAFT_522500 [Auriculariopsis ampla]TRM60295.1 hypothetical protein BD626DRAFT_504870 [Auriculariopsis ampla]